MGRPLQVGITGGIGSGKSLICRIFQCLGVPVYDADSRARYLMTTDAVLIELVKNEFGRSSYRSDGTLDRVYLGKATFGHPERLKKLNDLVHPRVSIDFHAWSTIHIAQKYLLREAALLFEAGSYKSVDKMIVVTAPESLRVSRVLTRDSHRSEDDIHTIIKSQWPEEEKIMRADFIIYNDDQQMVIPQVLRLHTLFKS